MVPPHVSMGFNQTWIFLTDVLPRAIKKYHGIDPEALRKAALDTDIPEGGTIQGYGVKFNPPEDDMAGQNDPQVKQIVQGMEQAMNQIGAPFPEEPVGIGAEWQYVNTMSQNGVSLTQISNYELYKMDGAMYVCDVFVQQTAPKQKVPSPLGVTVDLLSLSSQGTGKTKIDLGRLSPEKSIMSLGSTVKMLVPEKGQNKTLTMTTQMQIKVIRPGAE